MSGSIEKTKDPNQVEPFFFVYASEDGKNDGSTDDTGYLQGETISSSSTTVDSGITKDSENTDAVTVKGVSFGANLVATVWLSSGTLGETLQGSQSNCNIRGANKRKDDVHYSDGSIVLGY
jgi:hypothetical protein